MAGIGSELAWVMENQMASETNGLAETEKNHRIKSPRYWKVMPHEMENKRIVLLSIVSLGKQLSNDILERRFFDGDIFDR